MDESDSNPNDLERVVREAITELAEIPDPLAFEALLRLSDHLGQRIVTLS